MGKPSTPFSQAELIPQEETLEIQKTKGMNVSKEEVDILKHVHGSNKF